MHNLPKPSYLRTRGSLQEQINYLVNYLNTLVNALETSMGEHKANYEAPTDTAIINIAISDKGMIVTRADKSEQVIEFNKNS
ncbi:MAG: hypothetical protein NC213_09920 [Acetobacter sp.]|nr:hypothetical protein [Bacteroides sp.]MCM1342049.1 hypothetical protein [Acetobacter sp.]MCM1434265.1 hypothetical protein [Clostridiales bacterium]